MLSRLNQLFSLLSLCFMLNACQTPQGSHNLVSYFDNAGNTVSEAVAGGSYRKLLKKQANGWLVQNFFNDTNHKQTDPFLIETSQDFSVFMPAHIEGAFVRWYDNGQQAEIGHYQHGRKEGQFIEWDKQGNTLMEMTFANDLPHGKATLWYSQGTKYIEGQYNYGTESGTWYIRYPTGEIKVTINFSAGKIMSAKDANGNPLNLKQLKGFTMNQANQ